MTLFKLLIAIIAFGLGWLTNEGVRLVLKARRQRRKQQAPARPPVAPSKAKVIPISQATAKDSAP